VNTRNKTGSSQTATSAVAQTMGCLLVLHHTVSFAHSDVLEKQPACVCWMTELVKVDA
jgi:hypothetical protein